MLRPTLLSRLVVSAILLGGGLVSCTDPPPPPVEMTSTADVDKEVLDLVQSTHKKLEADPRNTALRVDLALAYEANQLWHEANQAWAQALLMQEQQGVHQERNTKGVQVYHQALCARQAGEVEEATRLLERAVEIAPSLPAAHHELAEAHLEIGELDEAESHYLSASRLAPNRSDPLVGLALVHLGRDEAAEAETQARKALAIEPNLKRAHYTLGLALRDQGRLDDAERELTLGLGAKARNMSDPLVTRLQSFKTGYHARISEAVNYVQAGNAASAVRLLEPILSTHPNDETLLNNLAVAYTHLGQHQKAREVLLKVIAVEPTSFPAYINLTAAELELGLNAEALQHADLAVRYAPDVAKSRFVRARAYMVYQRWNEAYADLKKSVQIQGDDPINHFLLAEVCQEMSNHSEALQEYEAALRLDQSLQYVWIELGFSAAAVGNIQRAVEAHRKAASIHGSNDPRVQALARMISGG